MIKIISISLAFILLTFSTGVGLAFHYCGGSLAQFKFVIGHGEASCGMEYNSNCDFHHTATLKNVSCCSDKFLELKADEYTNKQKQSLISDEYFYSLSPTDISSLRKKFETDQFRLNKPPPEVSSVSLPFIQVFII